MPDLRGKKPTIFNGSRNKSEMFLEEFDTYKDLNDAHKLMTNPYR
jgi:hypothetical protein